MIIRDRGVRGGGEGRGVPAEASRDVLHSDRAEGSDGEIAPGGHRAGRHRDDSVADLSGGAGVVAADAGGGPALLLLAGLVEDQYRTGYGQVS